MAWVCIQVYVLVISADALIALASIAVFTYSPLDLGRSILYAMTISEYDSALALGALMGIALCAVLMIANSVIASLVRHVSRGRTSASDAEYDPSSPAYPSKMEHWDV